MGDGAQGDNPFKTSMAKPNMQTQEGMTNNPFSQIKGPLNLNQSGNLSTQGKGDKSSSNPSQGQGNTGNIIGKILSSYPGASQYTRPMSGGMGMAQNRGMGDKASNAMKQNNGGFGPTPDQDYSKTF